MDIGVVLQTDPPASEVVRLMKAADERGFTYGWTFDSVVLWQEPFVIYSQILAATKNLTVGPMVTNPSTRDWSVTASLFATLNEWVDRHYRDRLTQDDLADPLLLREGREALDSLTSILGLGSIYPFQR